MKNGDTITLVGDKSNQSFTIDCKTEKISRGPIGQFEPSLVWKCKDNNGGIWYFREDSIKLKTK